MNKQRFIVLLQVAFIVVAGWNLYKFAENTSTSANDGQNEVVDSNGVVYTFEETPTRIAITNTYAATVMKMLDANLSSVVGVSGDFENDELWPEFASVPMIQNSAHSEIDFEALLDVRPDVYIVFATNGMVDTEAIRQKLTPVGIHVLALDFYKYDSLRYEIGVMATLFDRQDESERLFSEFDEIEALIASRASNISLEERPSIVMEHHASLTRDPVVLTGTSQWTDLIEMAGGTNVFSDLPGHTTHVDLEAIIDSNPEVLMFDGITFEIGYDQNDPENKCSTHMLSIRDRPGFDKMQAVENDRMLVLAGEFAGPMMVHGLPTLAQHFHPSLFDDIDASSYLDGFFADVFDVERKGTFICES
ncbi:MAG: hypothetical protein CMB34_02815 [Euryarchaeota archaeon]|nr:hypothetical protein [Euryarchaeota archaeon]